MTEKTFLNIFPKSLHFLMGQAAKLSEYICEIRFRIQAPVIVICAGKEYFADKSGYLIQNMKQAYCMTKRDMDAFLQYSCKDSVYAFEEEIKKGFLTIQGGHRIGIAGQVVLDITGNIKTIKNISCFNIRIEHEILGVANEILPVLYHNRHLQNTLIISPPGCGKTALLRDIVRQISDGNAYGDACQISVVDERSEIAGSYKGIPQNNIGKRTDVMDACPKTVAMMMLLRSMAPQVMAVDELGGREDIEALMHVINSGCSIIATMHGESMEEIRKKKYMQYVLEEKIFRHYILLSKDGDNYMVSAVETLGSTTVICSDKTGTLTQNKMTIQKIYDAEKVYSVSGSGYSKTGEVTDSTGNKAGDCVKRLIEGGLLCNDSIYDPEKETIIGDPTEGAMVVLAYKCNMEKKEWEKKYPRMQEIPFDSDRKLMSTFHNQDGQLVMYTKGAPDELLKRCVEVEIGGVKQELTKEKREEILAKNTEFAESALRVIGVAYRIVDKVDTSLEAENNLVFVGLLGMIDPPREEAKEAIDICKTAGIQVKMITGDHRITASAIGEELGIITEGTVEGREISEMTEEQLCECVKHTSVFARVSPEHKVRLVDAVRANGNIAAMTGDGVNDAPSLKHADIGVAMGITGTDVSKEAADMILTDDNFASIVSAVAEGRTIYSNIRKVVGFLLSCNIGEILVILFAMLLDFPVPLVAIQLLSINLITDAFPAFALGMEKEEPGVMKRHPRDPSEPIVDKRMTVAVIIQSVALALGTLASFIYGYYVHDSLEIARSACFFTLVLGELLRAYSARSESRSIFKMRIFENGYLNKCVLVSILFMLACIYVPVLNPVFSTVPLMFDEMLMALVFAFLPMLGGETAKLLLKKFK